MAWLLGILYNTPGQGQEAEDPDLPAFICRGSRKPLKDYLNALGYQVTRKTSLHRVKLWMMDSCRTTAREQVNRGSQSLMFMGDDPNKTCNDITSRCLEDWLQEIRKGNVQNQLEELLMLLCAHVMTGKKTYEAIVLTQEDKSDFEMHTLDLHYTTMTMYDKNFKNVNVIFEKDNLNNTLGQVIAENGLKQIRIAETEKYPHVTFFFSGGREAEFEGEKRLMANSPKVATYDLQPEMSAHEVVAKIVPELEHARADFVCLNFANPDMVGHTGDYNAIIKAVETVDQCTKEVVEAGLKSDYAFIIIADHGNADFAINVDGSPNTAHTTNLVPSFLLNSDYRHLNNGKLGDIAPTILTIMGVDIPQEMTGNSLV